MNYDGTLSKERQGRIHERSTVPAVIPANRCHTDTREHDSRCLGTEVPMPGNRIPKPWERVSQCSVGYVMCRD